MKVVVEIGGRHQNARRPILCERARGVGGRALFSVVERCLTATADEDAGQTFVLPVFASQ